MSKAKLSGLLGSLEPTPLSLGKDKRAVDRQALENTPPGSFRVLTDERGNKWAVLPLEDFEHILSLANLRPQSKDKG